MRIAVSIYSFSQAIHDGRLTPLACVSKAKEMGFDAIEFVDFVFDPCADREAFARQLHEECARVGIPVSNYCFGADFLNGSNGDVKAEIEKAKRNIDIAQILGAPNVRHDVTAGPNPRKWLGYDNVLPRLADAVRQVTEYAAAKGIRTTTENHGHFSQESLRVEKLVNTVAHENFGLLCDIGNFLCADDDPVLAVGRVAPYAFYVHVKDFHVIPGDRYAPGQGFSLSRGGNWLRGAIIGHGNVPVLQCLRILKNAGYDGTLSIEFEGLEDCILALSIGLENLRGYLAQL